MVRRADLRLLPVATLSWGLAVLGIVGSARLATWALVGVMAVSALALCVPAVRRHARTGGAHLLLLLLAVALLLPALHRHDSAVAALQEAADTGRLVTLTARVVTEPESTAGSQPWAAERTGMRVRTEPGIITAGTEQRALHSALPVYVTVPAADSAGATRPPRDGDRVQLRGTVRADDRLIVLSVREILVVEERGPASELRELRHHLRDTARAATAHLPPDEAALVRGMTTGDTHGLSERSEEVMQRGGITHLVAVSGANIALVIAAVVVPLLLLGVRRRPRILAAAGAMGVYVWLVGDEPSVQRAATMAAPLLLARFVGVPCSPVAALAMTVAVWSALDPVTSASVGFLLSALATASILIAAPPVADVIVEMTGERISRAAALVVAVPLLAQLVCTPLLILLEPEISLWAVAVNMAVAPFIGPGTVIGLLGLGLGLIWLPGAQLLCTLAAGTSHLVLAIASLADALPGSRIAVPEGPVGALGAVTVLLLAALALRLRRLRAVRFAVLAVTVALTAPSVVVRIPGAGIGDWHVAACAVGQGDAVLARVSQEGPTVLIDTGPEPEALTACLRRLQVDRIDLLVLTHPHEDHVGGRAALRGRWAPHEQWVCPSDAAQAATVPAAKSGAPAQIATTGRQWRGEASADDGAMVVDVLWPPSVEAVESAARREEGGGEGDSANDCSVAVAIRWGTGHRLIALGDLEPVAQRELAALGPGRADVVKVAHHGSRRQHAPLYEQVDADTALVTVGRENSFGHPTAQTLDMLTRGGARILRTDEHGTIVVDLETDEARSAGPGR